MLVCRMWWMRIRRWLIGVGVFVSYKIASSYECASVALETETINLLLSLKKVEGQTQLKYEDGVSASG